MSDLNYYLERANEAKAATLRQQWADAVERRMIVCICGRPRALELAFRCLYCGIYFCVNCAERHFGQTRQEWRIKHQHDEVT